MPSETAPQDRVWMAFPVTGYSLGDTEEAAHEARSTWAAVAHAIAEFEPVTVVVDPSERAAAGRYLSSDLDVVEAPLNDAWMRDIGPTFVHADDGSVAAVDWKFNGWGQQDWARWDLDEKIALTVAEHAGVHAVRSSLVNEGGGIQVDGEGTVLVTQTVQLDPGRNPGLTRADVEVELARTIGATHVVWLPRGLARDSEQYGTRGHVDIVAAITSPGRLLVHTQHDASHPDHAICREIRAALEASHDAAGRSWEIVDVPAPATLTDAEGFVDYSYINHLVVNGGVIACSFGDRNDAEAAAILAEQYPGRKVVSIDARPLFERGGGIHCITQNQPAEL
ncbi:MULTISPECIES: agmatine deiminase family protein [unclassified Mycolicibacterium]|uniref:agmatine deiminase family protein n=1 Tax=unclassified Mycolicibacterium TaxID=2636767 RepID=UPI001F4BFE51|nr:agmatine deiminase family protein [Mycolicibacterium sp. YH-1]UNB56063.1 agmatine deiminase family protein [Mycolicibacterium sp. YH-1]